MELVFAVSLLLIVHAYFGYPLSLKVLGRVRPKPVIRRYCQPPVTLIIAACNEERRIGEKLENTLALDYPREKLQVIVTSDGSSDGTNAIVRGYAAQGIGLHVCPERKGKENAQKEALEKATGEIVVFSDVSTMLDPQGISEIVANFADPSVGCVSSVDRVIGRDGKPCGEGFYVRYEMWLRKLESRANSLVGLSGSFFAARREVCRGFSGDMQSDFRMVLASNRMGLRGVSDPAAVGYYRDISDGRREFDRKVRTVLRGLTVMFHNLEFLNLFRYGLFSYQYFCHKLLRWLVPLFLATALTANAALSLKSTGYAALLAVHCGFYGIAAVGWWANSLPRGVVLKVPLYFVTVNAAIAVAWWRFISGKRMVMWSPSQR
ncbi:glycosyltransferase family 2 protein [Geobacter sp. SVR]|uniref:glycosyltransferase family 2 protein n=1 Tax=Geobacter sp. SVR TaxID=2495594 RepID=UPI00143EFA88|nr:glycosyltransferase family 2 protein [Geobacter sp. SVR]BCS54951.1 glycosyl transferase [Geobacter sp. SVR]GCF86150.1 glycosyl transferase [Geobacter sp. SVR]